VHKCILNKEIFYFESKKEGGSDASKQEQPELMKAIKLSPYLKELLV